MIMGIKPLRILSIDDDRSCQIATAKYLTFAGGHMVEVAENGLEGLKKAAELKPDIILLDMNMPDMSGLQLIEELYYDAATRDIPVIMITGAALRDDEQANLKTRRNFRALEQKPARFSELLVKIEQIVRPYGTNSGSRERLSGDQPEAA